MVQYGSIWFILVQHGANRSAVGATADCVTAVKTTLNSEPSLPLDLPSASEDPCSIGYCAKIFLADFLKSKKILSNNKNKKI